MVDDLLAIGCTIEAITILIRYLGGDVAHIALIINLPDIGGAERLKILGLDVYCMCEFTSL